MATNDEMLASPVSKLAGFALMILGLVLMGAGYGYGNGWYGAAGIVLLLVGVALVARNISRRNRAGLN